MTRRQEITLFLMWLVVVAMMVAPIMVALHRMDKTSHHPKNGPTPIRVVQLSC